MNDQQAAALLSTDQSLRAEADALLDDTRLLDKLRPFGELIVEGSYVYRTMVDRDIDVRVVLPSGKPDAAIRNQVVTTILELPGLQKLHMVDLTEQIRDAKRNDGIWVGATVLHAGNTWNIDIWLFDQVNGNKQLGVYEQLMEMTDEQRLMILAIKQYCLDTGIKKKGYTSTDIYQAVLGESITTPEEYVQKRELA